MDKKANFSFRETFCLMTLLLITKIFFTSISILIKLTGTAAWYTTLVSGITAAVGFTFVYMLIKRFPGYDLVQIFKKVTGKVLGSIISLLFCAYYLFYAGSNLREFLEMIKAFYLPYTPPSFILVTFLFTTALLSYLGLEVITRLSTFVFYVVITVIAAIILFVAPNYNLDNLFPIGGYGIKTTLYHGLFRSSAYDEIVLLAFIASSIKGSIKNIKKAGYWSLLTGCLIISLTTIFTIMTFEYTQGSENLSSFFQLSRVIHFNRFFQRFESIFMFGWVFASVITVTFAFFIAVYIFSNTFGIKDYKPLIMPFIFITFMLAIIPENLSQLVYFNIIIIRESSAFLIFFIPILVLITAVALKKKGDSKNGNMGKKGGRNLEKA